MNRPIYTLFVAASMLLAGCNSGSDGQPPLAGAKMGGGFTLTNQNGTRVSDSAYPGKYRLIYFGYTYCPDVCPTDMQRLMRAFKVLEKRDSKTAEKIQPFFISVDPARDTPQVVRQFVSAFHPRLIGLTGTEAQIADVASRYGVYFERGKPNEQGGYLVNHSNNTVLYGPNNEPLAIIPNEGTHETIADELARWVK